VESDSKLSIQEIAHSSGFSVNSPKTFQLENLSSHIIQFILDVKTINVKKNYV